MKSDNRPRTGIDRQFQPVVTALTDGVDGRTDDPLDEGQ